MTVSSVLMFHRLRAEAWGTLNRLGPRARSRPPRWGSGGFRADPGPGVRVQLQSRYRPAIWTLNVDVRMLLPSASHPVWCEVHRVSHESYNSETRKFLEELKVAMEAKDMSRVVKDLG